MNQPTNGKTRKRWTPALTAVVFGIIVLVLLVAADQLSVEFGLRESQRVVDDFLGALVAGFLAYRLERNRWMQLNEKLKTIELMNHHVRNALQVIMDSAYVHGHPEQLMQIRRSAMRIDWALREILPGHVADSFDDPVAQNEESNDPAA